MQQVAHVTDCETGERVEDRRSKLSHALGRRHLGSRDITGVADCRRGVCDRMGFIFGRAIAPT